MVRFAHPFFRAITVCLAVLAFAFINKHERSSQSGWQVNTQEIFMSRADLAYKGASFSLHAHTHLSGLISAQAGACREGQGGARLLRAELHFPCSLLNSTGEEEPFPIGAARWDNHDW